MLDSSDPLDHLLVAPVRSSSLVSEQIYGPRRGSVNQWSVSGGRFEAMHYTVLF